MALNTSKCNHLMLLRFKGLNTLTDTYTQLFMPHEGSGVTRIGRLHFQARCHKRCLNQGFVVLSLS